MKFRNKSDDTRAVDALGVAVEVGECLDVSDAAGLVLQCGPDGAWEPADDEAKAAVAAAIGGERPHEDTPAPVGDGESTQQEEQE